MFFFVRIWLLMLLLLITACQKTEVADLPLDTHLIRVTDKFYDVKALSVDKAIVVGYGGKILMTTDGGKTWSAKDSGTQVALYNVAFADGQNGWICGQDGLILRTKDGGETWQQQESGIDLAIFALSFVDANQGWAVAQYATYLHTTNGGESWTEGHMEASLEGVREDATLAMVDPTLYDLQFLNAQTGWMVGEFGKIYHTKDGGTTWEEQQNALLGQAGITDALNLPTWFGVRFKNETEGIVVGLEAKIAKTTDGGQSWTYIAEDFSLVSTDPFYAPLWLNNGEGWIVGASGRVLHLNGGEWKLAALGLPAVAWFRAIDFYDDNSGWIVGGYGMILRTTDGGKNWLPSVG